MWLGATRGSGIGYPSITLNSKSEGAHRVMLQEALGRPLRPGMFACHRCDVSLCVNPGHLYEGSALDNARDMVSRERHVVRRGEDNSRSILSSAHVIEIRRSTERGVQLAMRYGVSPEKLT